VGALLRLQCKGDPRGDEETYNTRHDRRYFAHTAHPRLVIVEWAHHHKSAGGGVERGEIHWLRVQQGSQGILQLGREDEHLQQGSFFIGSKTPKIPMTATSP